MFTCSYVRLAWSLSTAILLVLIHALPYEIFIRITPSPIHSDTEKECVQQSTHLLNVQPILSHAWEIFIPAATVLVISLVVRWCASPHSIPHVPRRSHSVLAAPRVLGDSIPFSLPPHEEIDDARYDGSQRVTNRGKSTTTASAFDRNPTRRNALQDLAILQPSIEKHDPDPGENSIPPADAPVVLGLLLQFFTRFFAGIAPHWIRRADGLTFELPPTHRIAFGVEVARSSSLPDPKRPTEVVQPRSQTLPRDTDLLLPYPVETHGLQKSLSTGSKDLSAQDTGNLSVLFVASGKEPDDPDHGLDDPDHDLGVFQRILSRPIANPAMRFSPLSGDDLTPDIVKGWIIWLHLLAFLYRSKLIVFMAGHGDAENRMCLPNQASLAECDILRWLSKIRARLNLRGAQTPTFILDICRTGNIRSISTGGLINIVRSCSPGEFAQAIGFDPENVSRSSFYTAFFLAANDRLSTTAEFKNAMRDWLRQLGRLSLRSYHYYHGGPGGCDCVYNGAPCDRPGPQTLEEGYEGWADLHLLGKFIATNNADAMRAIVDAFIKNMEEAGLWSGNSSVPSTSQGAQTATIVQPTSAVITHPRGATLPVSQAEFASPRGIVG